jgi:hypothetical protein
MLGRSLIVASLSIGTSMFIIDVLVDAGNTQIQSIGPQNDTYQPETFVNRGSKDLSTQRDDFARKQQSSHFDSTQYRYFPSILLPLPLELAASENTTIPELSPEEEMIFQELMREAIDSNLYQEPIGNIIQTISGYFLGSPYAANLLDQSPQESLVITLQQFDCVLFVETVLALSRNIAMQDYSTITFATHLQEQRYRNGEMDGYCSRLHYFSEWIQDNSRKGVVLDLTQSLGGVPLDRNLNFMTSHWQSYTQLTANPDARQCIAQMEASLPTDSFFYIPYHHIGNIYSYLQPGDIIGIATSIDGLDVTHTGLIYRTSQGNIGLIHSAPGGVRVAEDLKSYVSNISNSTGILVARPVDFRVNMH